MFTFLITFTDGATRTVRVASRSAAYAVAYGDGRPVASVVEVIPTHELSA